MQLSKPVKKTDNAQLIHKLKKNLQAEHPGIHFVSSIERRGDEPKLYLRTSGKEVNYTSSYGSADQFKALALKLGYTIQCEITSTTSSDTAAGKFLTVNFRIHSISSRMHPTMGVVPIPIGAPVKLPSEVTPKESPSLVQAMKDYSPESIQVTIEQNGNKKQYSLHVGDERALKLLIGVLTDAASKKVKLNLRGIGTTPDSTGLIEPEDIDGVMGVFDTEHEGTTWTCQSGLKLTKLGGTVIATRNGHMWIAMVA